MTRKQQSTRDYPFIIFRANNHEHAFEKALQLGREQETVFKNIEGNDVRWALVKVEEIWELGENIDGIEIGSLMDVWKTDKPIPFNFQFEPEKKRPTFSDKP